MNPFQSHLFSRAIRPNANKSQKWLTRVFLIGLTLVFIGILNLQCSDTNEDSLDALVANVPNPKTLRNSWVEDSAGVLTDSSVIDQMINAEESASGLEIAVVTLPTIGSYVPKDFAVALFNYWKIGKKEKDNGILILHIIDQRRVEIEIGYGLEGDLPDATVKRIIDTYTIPAFKADNFQKGHADTVAALINKINHPEILVDDLLTNTNANFDLTDVSSEPAYSDENVAVKRTNVYDYQGKAYVDLSQEEKQILDQTIELYNTTPNFFLNDEESRLLNEKIAEGERLEREESFQFKTTFILGYLGIFLFLNILQRIIVWLTPSPTAKYHIVHKTDFFLYYGLAISPLVITITVLSLYLGEALFPVSIFLIIGSIVVYFLFFGDHRMQKLKTRLQAIRNIPRTCKHCGNTMTKLSEEADNKHLSAGQISEEIVNSVDYDVWVCQSCKNHSIFKFRNISPEYIYKGTSFPKIKVCPECKFETFVCKSSRVLSEATYSSSGKVEVRRNCAHCKHHVTEYETIPKKQKSSSGSGGGGGGGGSFGGGSSGGGGSGGSY
ncbi:PF04536 family protein [Leptospira yanagawae serovar Saopaulo str. Sao Paulo = ATCC 700523]|uniref:PF04536 family protein n=1 Tax=Leptospira yanagawae serovar Saopaulo str. Sao Paulo = ATCC 700523 TaxID=1249483 RepID=A0A5E8HHC4_9LEPT|nr:TPM domain-containing protein [Leptospira yanagawae]EOQ90093.1 PF04536 family protein [Leptospira yanagawae serovar Saopaulo str. Sao Paulo = ATCC 700523]